MGYTKIKANLAALDARLESMHRRRPYVLWSIAVCVTLYFGVALYGKTVTWYNARDQLFRAFDEVETLRTIDVNDSVEIDNLYRIVTDSNYQRDTTVVRRCRDLLYRFELRKASIDSIKPAMDSIYIYLKNNAPVWERLKFHK